MDIADVDIASEPVHQLADETLICQCRQVSKGAIAAAVRDGHASVASLGHATAAGTGCTSCHDQLECLIAAYKPRGPGNPGPRPSQPGAISPAVVRPVLKPVPKPSNAVEKLKLEKDGLDSLPDLLEHAEAADWESLTEDDKARFKWHGLFFRKQTPGHFMLRLRMTGGATNAAQFRVIADLCDERGKGFCDITTRQQIQLRWFGIRRRSGNVGTPRRRRIAFQANRYGQHSRRRRLPAGRCRRQRTTSTPARRPASFHRTHPRRQGVHEPAAKIQRHHHRLSRKLLPH